KKNKKLKKLRKNAKKNKKLKKLRKNAKKKLIKKLQQLKPFWNKLKLIQLEITTMQHYQLFNLYLVETKNY
ncbi:hypothetical protein A5832_001738, partial [Enterococcus faecium]